MLRQVLAVVGGIVVSYIAMAVAGYMLYQLSGHAPPLSGPVLARYLGNPCIALLAGATVGMLARSRPVVLAALSLAPWVSSMLLFRRQSASNTMFLLLLGLLYVLVGMGAAAATFRLHPRIKSRTD